jgi:hypothetical protein
VSACGYPDSNDCNALHHDPAFKLAVGRLPDSGGELCSQPPMSRLENLPSLMRQTKRHSSGMKLQTGRDGPPKTAQNRGNLAFTGFPAPPL